MLTDKGYTPTGRNWTPANVRRDTYLVDVHINSTGAFIPPGYKSNPLGYRNKVLKIQNETKKLLCINPDETIKLKNTLNLYNTRQYVKNNKLGKITPENWEIVHKDMDKIFEKYDEIMKERYFDHQFQ